MVLKHATFVISVGGDSMKQGTLLGQRLDVLYSGEKKSLCVEMRERLTLPR